MFIFESESKRNATELSINDAVPLLTEKNLEKTKANFVLNTCFRKSSLGDISIQLKNRMK